MAGFRRTVDNHSDRGCSGKSISGHSSKPDPSNRIEKGHSIGCKKNFNDHRGRLQLRIYINPKDNKIQVEHIQISYDQEQDGFEPMFVPRRMI